MGDGSARQPHVRLIRNLRIPVDGGEAFLAADLYLPVGSKPCPVLVSVLPYQKDTLVGIGNWLPAHYFAANGYATLLVDFRGLGASSGDVRPPFDPDEANDGVAAVEWAARQPWSNGRVGMWGASYGAVLTLRTAARRPPPLQAILPIVGMLDPERDFVHPGGMRGCLSSLAIWAMGALMLQLLPPTGRDPEGEWREHWRHRLDADPWILDPVRHGPGHPVWRHRSVDPRSIETPALVVGGWRDLFCDGTVRAFEGINGPKKLLMGPWMHTLPNESPFDPIDFLPLALRWWDRWLRDEANGIDEEPMATLFRQGGRRAWQTFESWPPEHDSMELVVTGAGRLAVRAEVPLAARRPVAIRRPVDPTVGARSGLVGVPTRGSGLPLDQHDDDSRSIAFTSPPRKQAIEILGRPEAWVDVEASAGGQFGLVVKVADVDEEGRSSLITSGVAWRGESNTERELMRVSLSPTSYEVPEGHAIRLVIAAADFPRLWPSDPGDLTVHVADGPDGGTRLWLPVFPKGARTTAFSRPAGGCTPPPLAFEAAPEWSITTDLIGDRVSVSVGDQSIAKTPGDSHRLGLRSHVTASVARADPSSARVDGTYEATMGPAGGDVTIVRVAIELTSQGVVADGEVSVAGDTVFRRRWLTEVDSEAASQP